MATDAEESDTDEQPTKRLRLDNNDCLRMNQRRIETVENSEENNTGDEDEINEIERRAEDRLKKWQARQVAKGFVDNTINRVLENYVIAPPFGDAYSRVNLRSNDMEDRAVTMAIRNHGLVQPENLSANLDPPKPVENQVKEYWNEEEDMQVQCTCPLNNEQDGVDNVVETADTSDETFEKSEKEEGHDCWIGDKGDENNQQQDFLERAVAEAIKKKGLSALSIDYG